ncbi:MAG: DUF1579 domain-containing protein [Nitrospirae bacterium]|nr:DUF1579 domain-containing protein [Nitrospirota bacterium]NTW65197.1 DUF1579 domain-containing protein [Nitrospirota bacterium]
MAKKTEIDMQKIMEIYKKVGAPGEPHKLLAKQEGSWITKSRGWMEPGKPPVESTGTCEQKMIIGGHYLQQEYTDDMMGQPFAGINILGYNNHTKKYESVWLDSMSTAVYFFEGPASKDGKTITQECRYDDPVRGPSVWRSVTRIMDDNTLEFEMFITTKGGKEEKMMEMTISRKEGVVRKAA